MLLTLEAFIEIFYCPRLCTYSHKENQFMLYLNGYIYLHIPLNVKAIEVMEALSLFLIYVPLEIRYKKGLIP